MVLDSTITAVEVEGSGSGMITYQNGDVFEGHYVDAKPHGRDKMNYWHGAVYEGDWDNGIIHGEGEGRGHIHLCR